MPPLQHTRVEGPLTIIAVPLPLTAGQPRWHGDASGVGMLTPFADAFTEGQEPDEPGVPEVVPIEQLNRDRIEAAEAEIEVEEEWPQTA